MCYNKLQLESKEEVQMTYGRPLKNKTRRVPVTVHIPVGMLELIDNYVAEYAEISETSYSRSDFYNDAAVSLLQSKGIQVDDVPERTKNVPKKSEVKTTEDNTGNIDTKSTE